MVFENFAKVYHTPLRESSRQLHSAVRLCILLHMKKTRGLKHIFKIAVCTAAVMLSSIFLCGPVQLCLCNPDACCDDCHSCPCDESHECVDVTVASVDSVAAATEITTHFTTYPLPPLAESLSSLKAIKLVESPPSMAPIEQTSQKFVSTIPILQPLS